MIGNRAFAAERTQLDTVSARAMCIRYGDRMDDRRDEITADSPIAGPRIAMRRTEIHPVLTRWN